MSADDRLQQLACRVQDLYATDPEFAAAAPDLDACKAITKPGLRLADIVRILSERYADRPALGQRAVKFVQDAAGRTSTQLLPAFDTITYRQLWDRAVAISSALGSHPVQPGDRVCTLGFTSVDYTVVEVALALLGVVSVPLQTSAPRPQLISITDETEPVVIAAAVDYLPAAIELALHGGSTARVVVFDYHAEVDDHRESLAAARAQLADARSPIVVEPIDVLRDESVQPAAALQVHQRAVSGVGLGVEERRRETVLPRSPPHLRVPHVDVDRRPLLCVGVLRPHTLGAPEVGDARVGRDAGAGQHDDAPRPLHQLPGLLRLRSRHGRAMVARA